MKDSLIVAEPKQSKHEKTVRNLNAVKSRLGWIGVALIGSAYLGFSFLVLKEKDATLLEIIIRIAVSFLVGFSINRMLDLQGINAGLATDELSEASKENVEATKQLGKDRGKLRRYTNYLNRTGLADARETILSYEGLSYEDYFNKKGKFIGKYRAIKNKKDKVERDEVNAQNACIKKAIKHRVTMLSPQSLLSDEVRILDPNYQGETIQHYIRSSAIIDAFAKLAPAFIVGRIGVELVTGAALAGFILVAVELGLYILMGAIKYYMAFNFITKNYKDRIVNKTLQLRGIKDWEDPEEVKINGIETTRDTTETAVSSGTITSITANASSESIQAGATNTGGTTETGQNGYSTESFPIIGAVVPS